MLIRVCDCCEKALYWNNNYVINTFSIVEGRMVSGSRSSSKFKVELCPECLEKVEEFISDLKIAESESTGGIKNMHWGKKDDEDSSFDLDND